MQDIQFDDQVNILVPSIEEVTPSSLMSYIDEDLTFSQEGFISRLFSRISNFFTTISLDRASYKKAVRLTEYMHVGLLKGLLEKKKKFMLIRQQPISVIPEFTGLLSDFVNDLANEERELKARYREEYPALVHILETYISKPSPSIRLPLAKDRTDGVVKLQRKYFKGKEDRLKIGEVFANDADIVTYIKATKSLSTTSSSVIQMDKDLKLITNLLDELQERGKTSKDDYKRISGLVMSMAKLISSRAKVYGYIELNAHTAYDFYANLTGQKRRD
jgi:hypothetical protein